MNKLSKEEQLIAVPKVLEEMQYAQNFLSSWNLGWWEQLSNAYCLPIYESGNKLDIMDMEAKYKPRYRLAEASFNNIGIGVPLCSETLIGNNSLNNKKDIKYLVDFGNIKWFDINSKKAERTFTFSNTGDIHFVKKDNNKYSRKHPRRVSYNTQFNVLDDWFKINITISNLLPINDIIFNYNHILISKDKTHILMSYNNVQILYDLITGTKTIKTEQTNTKGNKDAIISYELKLNANGMLETGNVIIKVKSCSGHAIGTYQFDVSSTKGIRAIFYSRNGKAHNLIENKDMLDSTIELLPSLKESRDASTVLINNLVSSVKDSINKHTINSANSISTNLDINCINLVEREIIDTLKNIKGELPLKGLVERINSCLESLETLNANLISNNSKKRELRLNKKLR